MKAYINGIGSISPQKINFDGSDENEILKSTENSLKCIEPDYKNYISPALIRRMGRLIKMGVSSANIALQDAGITMPDAIITGTGLGCIEDTEKFLSAIVENKEQYLTPTSFIQSTHNTVGGQIALMLKCHNYNFTYVHRAFSFESCLVDAGMLLNENPTSKILVGGLDETTNISLKLLERLGFISQEKILNTELLKKNSRGALWGEGSNFFVLSNSIAENSYAQILDCKMIYNPQNKEDINKAILSFLEKNKLSVNEIDLLMCGYSGDKNYDIQYDAVATTFSKSSIGYFKHLCGEYHTASAFALSMSSNIIRNKKIADSLLLANRQRKPEMVLIYNQHRMLHHSLVLLKKC
jgi:3-oxoacyl-(acyl-carrier-protein) synthase